MTKAEYVAIYEASRDSWQAITATVMKEIRKTYIRATEDVAQAIAGSPIESLTAASLSDIQLQLQKATWAIDQAIRDGAIDAVDAGLANQIRADSGFLRQALEKSGAIERVPATSLARGVVRINERVVGDLITRMGSGGYALKTASGYEAVIKDLIAAGVSQGLDPAQIAREVTRYVTKGRDSLIQAGAWGKLRPGTSDYLKRLPDQIDWRALRIVRTELTVSMHAATVQQARFNAGSTGELDWIRANSEDWGCECPDLAAGGPYPVSSPPPVPHPNCMCSLRPRVRPFNEFVSDLERWMDGESVDYLDTWYAGGLN